MAVKNSYSDLISIMQEQGSKYNSPAIEIGTVISPPPNLIIQVGELQLDSDDLLVADGLLAHERNMSLISSAATDAQSVGDHGSHSHTISNSGFNQRTVKFATSLQAKDLVALLATENKQTYIVLCKVVKPHG